MTRRPRARGARAGVILARDDASRSMSADANQRCKHRLDRAIASKNAAAIVRAASSAWEFRMASTRFDVLGIGNAIVDVHRAHRRRFPRQAEHAQGRHGADRRGARGGIYDAMGPAVEMSGGSAANTIVGVASLGGPRGLRRQGQGRRARPRVRARHPRRGRRLRNAARLGRSIDRALLRAGHAGRRAHHEHLSRRRAGPASERHRRRRRSPPPGSPISKAICGIRRTPRRRSSRRPRSRMTPSATSR